MLLFVTFSDVEDVEDEDDLDARPKPPEDDSVPDMEESFAEGHDEDAEEYININSNEV